MSCFFGCFGAKDNKLVLDLQPPFALNDQEAAAVVTFRVSRNQLSDLFLSQEPEEVSSGEKSAPCNSVDTQCCKEKLPDHTWTPPANASESAKGHNSVEESPTSCISDPPSASRNSVSTRVKSDKANLHHTNKETLAPQTVSASDNKKSSNQKLKNGQAASHKNLPAQGSMSSGPRQVSHNKAGNIQANIVANGRAGRSPHDRPALGTITAQWNQEADPSRDPFKWWDGNGIPNSTNKYRETKNSRSAITPFEERLEKALSEANSIAQRKHISGAYDTFEEETDTAASQLHSLLHPKSVVSF